MFRKNPGGDARHRGGKAFIAPEIERIISIAAAETNDPALGDSIYFGPTALTHVKRLLDTGGTIITDTMLLANDLDITQLGTAGAKVRCFLDDPQVITLATQRRVTRAEVAVDQALTVPGLKLMVVGSAPAAINRILLRRQREPMSDVCVLAAPTGFASVIQAKERMIDSDLASIVVRGKRGGIALTAALMNAILREIAAR